MSIRISIIGAAGRMGRALTRGLVEGWVPNLKLAGAVDLAGIPGQGSDAGLLAGTAAAGVPLTADLPALKSVTDVFIDFSFHTGIPERAKLLPSWGVPWIIGTTGLTVAEKDSVREAAASLAVILAPNMSLGVNLLSVLVEQASRALSAEDFDIEIVEMHHRQKIDAPSGTAMMLGEAAAAGRGVDLAAHSDRGRDGITGARKRGDIGFAALRGGQVVGEHTLIFAAASEHISLTHKSFDRRVYATGAVRAALWAQGRAPGLYSMRDVLGM